jgi:hypothetical protein
MKEVPVWLLFLIVAGAGAVGGLVNAFLSDNGFVLPRKDENAGRTILRPGFLGNVLVGAVAAAMSWGLYGPAANLDILGRGEGTVTPVLTISAFFGALLVGVAGARVLSSEIDKRLLRAAASEAVSAPARSDLALKLLTESPANAWKIAAAEADRSSR